MELQNRDLDLDELQGSVEEVTTEKCRRAAEIVCFILLACPAIGRKEGVLGGDQVFALWSGLMD